MCTARQLSFVQTLGISHGASHPKHDMTSSVGLCHRRVSIVKRWMHFRTQISKFALRLVLDLRTSLLEQSGHNLFFFRGHPGDITPHGPPQRVPNLTNAALEQHVGYSTLYLSRSNGNICQNGWLLPYCRRSLSASCAAVFLSWICDIEWLLLCSLDTYLRYTVLSALRNANRQAAMCRAT